MTRFYRRFIVKYFGGTRNFLIWTAAVVVTIYFIDSYVLTRDRLESLVQIGSKQSDTEMSQSGGAIKKVTEKNDQKLPEGANPPSDQSAPKEDKKPPDGTDNKQTDRSCGLKEACPAGKYSYVVKAGYGRDGHPSICFNGNYAMTPEKANGHRGMNLVVVDHKKAEVKDVRYFDTYIEEGALVRFLKYGIEDDEVILVASMDEATASLKDDGKEWMRKYGGSVIDKLKFRDSFVMVGQRGLTRGSALEKYEARDRKDFADAAEMSGCVSFPMGKLTKIDIKRADVGEKSNLKLGEELPNCGVKDGCGPESFPVHLFTGKGNSDGPKICVNGKYVLAKGLNDGGRGLNIVIVDSKTKDVIRVGHFDTYSEDSSNLEIFLEMMNEKEIVLAVAHDDASKNLNEHAKKLFATLGSSMIEKLGFRDVWAFAGQKGIDGHSTFEEIEFAGPSSSFPHPIDRKLCVPVKLKGSQIKPDPLANKNERRRKFCAKYDGYGDFCESEHIDEALTPAPLADKSKEHNPIFKVPLIIIPGLNHNAVRMQLETVLMQSGIRPHMVTVMYDEKFDESAALADLFGFKTAKLSSSTKYVFQVQKALEKVWELYPEAKHVIVLEEEVILAPDCLMFMAQCLNSVDSDPTIIGLSAWNENGYESLSTNPHLAYRVQMLPGLGFLLKKSFYLSHIKDNFNDCCLHRSWDGWMAGKLDDYEMIVPDVSRVYRRPYEGLSEQADLLTELFNRPRVTNLETKSIIQNWENLTLERYEEELSSLFKGGVALDTSNANDCLLGGGLGFYIPETTQKTYAVFFEQTDADDDDILSRLCKCFKLFNVKKYRSRGLHKGLLRFTYKGNTMLFVGSSSSYYKFKPAAHKPVSRSLL